MGIIISFNNFIMKKNICAALLATAVSAEFLKDADFPPVLFYSELTGKITQSQWKDGVLTPQVTGTLNMSAKHNRESNDLTVAGTGVPFLEIIDFDGGVISMSFSELGCQNIDGLELSLADLGTKIFDPNGHITEFKGTASPDWDKTETFYYYTSNMPYLWKKTGNTSWRS